MTTRAAIFSLLPIFLPGLLNAQTSPVRRTDNPFPITVNGSAMMSYGIPGIGYGVLVGVTGGDALSVGALWEQSVRLTASGGSLFPLPLPTVGSQTTQQGGYMGMLMTSKTVRSSLFLRAGSVREKTVKRPATFLGLSLHLTFDPRHIAHAFVSFAADRSSLGWIGKVGLGVTIGA
ncbi:MAG: hypothetical protein A3C56_00080 [Ignavibacteria bacterium RIFCSPHIGHO2_02_FULL_56_12]|nr:MAG: hypothetical protein A3C56_00080 [Ignavibacteria bacterium RIFCSPHIGHO2_02_FULL_56_12]